MWRLCKRGTGADARKPPSRFRGWGGQGGKRLAGQRQKWRLPGPIPGGWKTPAPCSPVPPPHVLHCRRFPTLSPPPRTPLPLSPRRARSSPYSRCTHPLLLPLPRKTLPAPDPSTKMTNIILNILGKKRNPLALKKGHPSRCRFPIPHTSVISILHSFILPPPPPSP